MNIDKVIHKIGLLHSTSTETRTNFNLARIIVNKINVDWTRSDLKILDLSCGRGTFLLAILEKLLMNGHHKENAVQMLYGVDSSHVQSSIAKKALFLATGCEPNIYCKDSLIAEWDMKFDVIVGNPPYQAPKKGDYSFWARFVNKSHKLLNDDGYLSMIIPAGWMSPTNDIRQGQKSVMRDIFLKENTYYINVDPELGKKYFPGIGQMFTWFVLNKGTYHNTTLDFGDKTIDFDLSGMPMLAKSTDDININIIRKISSSKNKWNFTRYIMPETWDNLIFDKDSTHIYPRINGNSNHLAKVAFSKSACRYQDNKKVVLPYNGSYYKFVVDDGKYGCTNAYVMLLDNNIIIKSAETYFNSKLVSWLGKNKFTQYNEGALINSVSAIDLTKEITEEDIYDFYNLTEEERKYINNNA